MLHLLHGKGWHLCSMHPPSSLAMMLLTWSYFSHDHASHIIISLVLIRSLLVRLFLVQGGIAVAKSLAFNRGLHTLVLGSAGDGNALGH
jgi:hypothetical protein